MDGESLLKVLLSSLSEKELARDLPGRVHSLTLATAEEIYGQDSHIEILHLRHQGQTIWRRRAHMDTTALIQELLAWEHVCALA